MPVYPASSLVSLAHQCPAWEHIAGLMAAIALAESGGNSDAENYCCVGLWQVNVLAHKQYSRAQMRDPLANLQAACAIYKSQGLGAWESYTNGSYKKFIDPVNKSIKQAGGSEEIKGVGTFGIGVGPTIAPEASETLRGALSWTKELAKLLSFITSSEGWARIGKVVLGSAFLVIAIDQLTKIGPGPNVDLVGAAKKGIK